MSSETSEQFAAAYPWISSAYLERILRQEHQDDSIVVISYTLKPALDKGENFASQLLRVRVNFSSTKDTSIDHISLIVKTAISNNAVLAALTAEMGLFRKEIIAYQKIMPEVAKLLSSIGEDSRLFAKCYDASEELSYLVFEDLSVSGYTNVNRSIGLNVEHFKHLVTKAAKWHAATAVLVSKNKELVSDYQTSLIDTAGMKAILLNCSTALTEAVKLMPGFEHLLPKLQHLSECVVKKTVEATERNPDSFNVIIHGDLWSNNVMFHHDPVSGRPTDAILVDFQAGYVGSPVLDIVYSLFMSSSDSIDAHNWDEIVNHYHGELVRLLKKLAYSKAVPTYVELQAERLQRAHYAVTMALCGLTVRKVNDLHDNDNLPNGSEADLQPKEQTVPKFCKALEFLLHYCNDNGLLDAE